MNLNNYFKRLENRIDNHGANNTFTKLFKRIVCQDGFSLFVQANRFAYCSPRDNYGPYTEVEVGFTSEVPEDLWEYAEDPEYPTETVYSYVPIELVETLIEHHGGLANKEEGTYND